MFIVAHISYLVNRFIDIQRIFFAKKRRSFLRLCRFARILLFVGSRSALTHAIGAVARAFSEKILERHAVKVILDYSVELFPHRKSRTDVGSRAGIRIAAQA